MPQIDNIMRLFITMPSQVKLTEVIKPPQKV